MEEICGFHCPKGMIWAFTVLGAWFTLSAFGIPTYGGFWSWVVLLTGVCTYLCASDPKHRKTPCPFAGFPAWVGTVLVLVGLWFVLGNEGMLPLFDMNLLYLVFLIGGLGAALHP